ncbi:Rieske (2Fe-2S) protein [Micromonospora inositola]|uniref:Nitrite reductase (NADH) small subunit n=1 Tax=Micromonospora inositola TaxID=47865 RepID=A0A1C5JS48_9ACTN|nr:Rieske 2Fe-2S domain-containing protein [Micromonospora inositola]SCG73420.1 nitrite reductase (NADH) small subunit [Micromonospora inositola]
MSEPNPVEWVPVAELSELARRKRKQVVVGGTPIALFYVDAQVFALHDVCVHKQRSLSKGTILHGRIICPGHQWSFDPATGEAADQAECQPTYDVRVANGKIYVNPRQRTGRAASDAAAHPAAAAG